MDSRIELLVFLFVLRQILHLFVLLATVYLFFVDVLLALGGSYGCFFHACCQRLLSAGWWVDVAAMTTCTCTLLSHPFAARLAVPFTHYSCAAGSDRSPA